MNLFFKISFFTTICLVNISFAQKAGRELVKNVGFEDKYNCSSGQNAIGNSKYWQSANNTSVDYFNRCDNQVPTNSFGYAEPHSFDAYSGIIVFDSSPAFPNYSEYMMTTLKEELIEGNEYCVEMFVYFADISDVAIDNIGIYFAKDFKMQMCCGTRLDLIPQINSLAVLFPHCCRINTAVNIVCCRCIASIH